MARIQCFMITALASALAIAAGCTGGIRSVAHFTSEPSGAEVFVNEKPKGRTPLDMPFIWYWKYDVKLEKKGYAPFHTVERFRTPNWAILPLDLFAEAFPYPIPDNRYCNYQLKLLSEDEKSVGEQLKSLSESNTPAPTNPISDSGAPTPVAKTAATDVK